MPGRGSTLSRTRCPACDTVFRVTAEQLRLKAGKVRCGQCQTVFNAFDHLQVDEPPAAKPATIVPEPVFAEAPAFAPPTPIEELPPSAPSAPDPMAPLATEEPLPPIPEIADTDHATANEPVMAEPAPAAALADNPESEPEQTAESPEQSTLAAREAGLVAVRDLAESPVYDRWSAGTLADHRFVSFDEDTQKSPLWPYLTAFLLLLLLLAGQLAWHFRTAIVQHLPTLGAAYSALGIDVPLPRDVALVSIESSDLQSDATRGLFVLNATLKNLASHAQAWPSLELTLTDINDRVVARRILGHGDYLLPDTPKAHFPANGETGVRLWIDAKDLGATGYRLYIFYP